MRQESSVKIAQLEFTKNELLNRLETTEKLASITVDRLGKELKASKSHVSDSKQEMMRLQSYLQSVVSELDSSKACSWAHETSFKEAIQKYNATKEALDSEKSTSCNHGR